MTTERRSYTTIEVSKRLGVSLQTVQRWVDTGRLKAWKTLGGHRRIDASSAEQLFESQEGLIGRAAAPPDSPGPGQESAEVGADAAGVVIVDDDPVDRALLVELVELALPKARIQQADNGFQGLFMIAKSTPDVVVTDIHMPHMDGLEMLRSMLADDANRPRLLIAVSAKSSRELAEMGEMPAGVLLFTKPIDQVRFLKALRVGQKA